MFCIKRLKGSDNNFIGYSSFLRNERQIKEMNEDNLKTLKKKKEIKRSRQYSEITPEGIELILWGDLKIMMEFSTEENDQGDFWNNQQDWEIVSWRLYEACGVCILLKDGTVIYMLVERMYPLSKELLQRMLDLGLEVKEESTVALHLGGDTITVKAVGGDTHLGGEDFDMVIVNHCVQDLRKINFVDVNENARAMGRLKVASEKPKRDLSSVMQTSIEIDCLYQGFDFSLNISWEKFEELNTGFFMKCMEHVENCLRDGNMNKSDVDDVVIVGGSTRIPRIEKLHMTRDQRITEELRALASVTTEVVKSYKGFIINGFRFQIKELESKRKTQNSGVMLEAMTNSFSSFRDNNLSWNYGVINDIIELEYSADKKVVFDCDSISNGRRKKDEEDGFTLLNFKGLKPRNEPFILCFT
ncbi:putative heat shock protein 70 family protein [Tanacetum coccineum]|uniref:Heat shock protein 70 family protein n=1 Tax=Tanacetum coccineum TaxID=301880 RepID=A0ABQ5AGQ9_9ASTR